MLLEICCDSIASCVTAAQNGADRIELCENLAQGGVTPSAGKIKLAKQALDIPIFVLIRPRKADFLYSDLEFQLMLEDIQQCKALGADGIVSGILTADGNLDIDRMQALVEAAAPLPFTCHRAFDMCREPLAGIDQLAAIGVSRILTSGQEPNAVLGKANLQKMATHAQGKLSIMACGNLLPENISELLDIKELSEFHSAARGIKKSQMNYLGKVNMGDEPVREEFEWMEVDGDLVKGLKAHLV